MTSHRHFPIACAGFAAWLACAIAATPLHAADPVFPTGSRVGLVPPGGMVASDVFDGFSDPAKDAAILIAVLPAAAYSQIEKTLDTDALKKQGVNLEKREAMQLSFGKGFLLIGRQVADKTHYRKWMLVASASDLTALVTVQVPEQDSVYPDRVVRAALATLSVRADVPEAEELSLLPFAVTDLAGFHVDGVIRGRALMLGDASNPGDPTKAAADSGLDARLLIAALPGGPREPEDRANFARQSFGEIGGIKDVQITMSEPLRINNQSGYQTMAAAKDLRTGADVMVVQWLRFGSGGYLQMVGIARADGWTGALARLRTVRDSIDNK
ncbi:MAG: hypothetical protein P4L80_15420 [Xanthobacteraceae bacterium]|nr:hypothetical protein [Xanthobacteraceae bacterium]